MTNREEEAKGNSQPNLFKTKMQLLCKFKNVLNLFYDAIRPRFDLTLNLCVQMCSSKQAHNFVGHAVKGRQAPGRQAGKQTVSS